MEDVRRLFYFFKMGTRTRRDALFGSLFGAMGVLFTKGLEGKLRNLTSGMSNSNSVAAKPSSTFSHSSHRLTRAADFWISAGALPEVYGVSARNT